MDNAENAFRIFKQKEMIQMAYDAQACLAAFCKEMNRKAAEMGMARSEFRDPAGIDNVSTAEDMVRCILHASRYEALYGIWNKPHHTVHIAGEDARLLSLASTVVAADESHCLSDFYPIVGGKTGTVNRKEVYNLVVLVKAPDSDDVLACAMLGAEQPNGNPKNRFVAAKQALDATMRKYRDSSADNKDAKVCASAVAVCRKPKNYTGHLAELPLLFEKNAKEQKIPASTSKILTAILTLDYISDLQTKITVEQGEIDAMLPRVYDGDLRPGDVITVQDALYAMFLPSSNAAAYVLGRFVGQTILMTQREI